MNALAVLSTVFWFVVTFSILVVIHEGGHFAMARAFGVHVHEFMIGLPGPAVRYHGKRTDYGVTAIPLGGYVRIAGMEPGPEDPRLADALALVTRMQRASVNDVAEGLSIDMVDADALLVTLADWNAVSAVDEDVYESHFTPQAAEDPVALLDSARETTYAGLPTWKRIVLLSAGVFMNIVAALLVFVLLLTLYGVYQQTLTIDSTMTGSGAAAAGLAHGDTLKAIDGVSLKDWDSLIATVSKHKPGQTLVVSYDRGGVTRTASVTLMDQNGAPKLGIIVQQARVHEPLGQAVRESFSYVGEVVKVIAGFFSPRTFHASLSQSSSVIGVSIVVAEEVKQGPANYAFIVAALSLSLGLVNILPIPPLDGGKVAVEIVQRIAGRPLSRNFSLALSAAGTALLFAFIGYLMYADVVRYVVKGG